jgi:hypothetical protein
VGESQNVNFRFSSFLLVASERLPARHKDHDNGSFKQVFKTNARKRAFTLLKVSQVWGDEICGQPSGRRIRKLPLSVRMEPRVFVPAIINSFALIPGRLLSIEHVVIIFKKDALLFALESSTING